jgi:hypothetical protein
LVTPPVTKYPPLLVWVGVTNRDKRVFPLV